MVLGQQGTQAETITAGILGITTGVADAIPVMIDSLGQRTEGELSPPIPAVQDEEIEDMAGASNGVLSLRPVTFRYKQAFKNRSKPLQYGLIAEEVADVFPDLVVYDEDSEPETVKYRLLARMLLNELQKQQGEFQALQQVTADQTAQLVSLEQPSRALERDAETTGHRGSEARGVDGTDRAVGAIGRAGQAG